MRNEVAWKSSVALLVAAAVAGLAAGAGTEPESDVRGKYCAKKSYPPKPLPKFEDLKDQLRSPI